MPTYERLCADGHTFSIWRSIHDDSPILCSTCGVTTVNVISRVMTHGIGSRGAKTIEVDARERRWAKDMPAYKRFRDRGHQPPSLDGADRLEATAKSEIAIQTGGRINVPDRIAQESAAMAADITAGRL